MCDSSCPKNPGNEHRRVPIFLHQEEEEEGYTTDSTCSSSDDDDGDSVLDEIVSELLGDEDDVVMSDGETIQTLRSESDSCKRRRDYSPSSSNNTNDEADMSWDPDVESLE